MAFQRAGIDAEMQGRLREMAAQVRQALYGRRVVRSGGTRFREMERTGMSVGWELARLVMEQVVAEQSQRVPDSALVVEGDVVQLAGREMTPLETEAGPIQWSQPRTMLKQGRKAFFPQYKALGLKVGEALSPVLVEKLAYLALGIRGCRKRLRDSTFTGFPSALPLVAVGWLEFVSRFYNLLPVIPGMTAAQATFAAPWPRSS